jgi:CO dehydrogenase/acetyl-CoA synthase gamma subunit (corrinoid Fe-S protein)
VQQYGLLPYGYCGYCTSKSCMQLWSQGLPKQTRLAMSQPLPGYWD